MSEPSPLQQGLLLASGVLWSVTYLALIATTHRTRLTGMPYFALMLNIGWETVFSLITPHQWPQRAIDLTWLALDAVILLQTLVHYPHSAPALRLPYALFLAASAATYATSLAVHWAWSATLDPYGAYSAFAINLIMSVAYVAMFCMRVPRGAGLSIGVAACKLVGSLCASVAFYLGEPNNALLNVLCVATLVWDVVYIALLVCNRLHKKGEQQQQDDQQQYAQPWMIGDAASAGSGMRISHASLTEPSAASRWHDST